MLSACAAPAKAQAADDEKLARILRKVQSKLDEARIASKLPGATVGFTLPDGRSASVSTGLADVKTNTPLKPSDRLLAGSIGKTFVAAAALLLVEDGTLKLDERVERWLGGEKWFARLPNSKEITLRMLLNHSSGIRNHVDEGGFMRAILKNSAARNIAYEELVAYVLDKKPLFAAGRGYNYADTNYILAGMVIERATGRRLYELIAERILKPLKLERTIPSNSVVLPEVANGYLEGKPVIVGGRFTVNPQWEWAGGGFASTAEDLARWARALYGGEVLRRKSLEEMLGSTSVGEGAVYGLGVETVNTKWGKAYGHDGEFPGYLSDMRYFPKHGISVAVMVNSDVAEGVNRFLSSAVEEFAQLIIEETAARTLAEADKARLRELAEGWLKLVDAGRYEESWEGVSAELKAKYARERWRAALQPFLSKVGKIKARSFKSAGYSEPDAEVVAVAFESAFTKLRAGSETVMLKLEADGRWRVASYTIH